MISRRLRDVTAVLFMGAGLFACQDDDHGEGAESIADVVYLDETTDEALLTLLDAAPVDDEQHRLIFDLPAEAETLPATPVPTFAFQEPVSGALPARPGKSFLRAARALGKFLNPISVAHAHGTPFNGRAYFLVFSSDSELDVLRVFTAATSYTPDAEAWALLSSAADPLTLEVISAEFENNLLALGGGPFAGGAVSFTIE